MQLNQEHNSHGALQRYILEIAPSLDSADVVILENIDMAEELGGTNIQLKGHLVMGLVNLQEEATFKNTAHSPLDNSRAVY